MRRGLRKIIEIAPKSIKAMASQDAQGQRIIVLAESAEIEKWTDENTTKSIKQLVYIKKKDKQDTLVLSRKDAILLRLTLPSSQPEEMDKMIKLQLVQHIPYDREDVVFKYYTIKERLDGYVDILVVILLKEKVLKYINLMKKCGLHVSQVTISSLGIAETFYRHLKKKDQYESDMMAVLHVDQTHSEICFCHASRLLYSRFLPFGWQDLDSDQGEIFFEQIDSSIRLFEQQRLGTTVKSIWVLCLKDKYPQLGTMLLKKASFPIHWIPYGEDADEDYTESLANDYQAKNASFATIHGLALDDNHEVESINLLPQNIVTQRRDKIWHHELIKCGIYVVLIFLFYIAALFIQNSYKKNIVAHLDEKLQKVRPWIRQLNQKKEFIKFVEAKQQEKVFLIDVFLALTESIQENVFINSMKIRDEKTIELEGYALTNGDLNKVQKKLSQSSYFKDINLQLSRNRRYQNREVIYFILNFKIAKQGKPDAP